MFEVLVFMFENYFANHTWLDNKLMAEELSAAGFDQTDIEGAFDWFQEMKSRLDTPQSMYTQTDESVRIFTQNELAKISTESFSFILFLRQAGVINNLERDLIIDRAMALKQEHISIQETRWITMIALWNIGREKDYLFVEDALFNPRGLTVH